MASRRANRRSRTPKKNADPIRVLFEEIMQSHESPEAGITRIYRDVDFLEHAMNGILFQISSARFEQGTAADERTIKMDRAGAFKGCLKTVALIALHGLLDAGEES